MLRIPYPLHVLLLGLWSPAAPAPCEPAAPPWQAAFAAEAAAIAHAAAEIDAAGADVAMLLRDDSFSFDEAGRMTHRRRWVYRILEPAGLEDWSVSETGWSPWHQARPEVRVRVIRPDGGERWLDSAELSDLAAEQAGLDGERRLVRGRLPVALGTVVEEEVVLRDTRPLFAGGLSVEHLLVLPVPILHGRLTLEAPASLPLRFEVKGMAELEGEREAAGERLRWVFDYGRMPAAGRVESGLPAEAPRYPHIAFSTGESWQQIAADYAREIARRSAESDARKVRRWLPDLGLETRRGRIEELVAGIRGNVRLEAAEFGSRDPVPTAPLETLRRGTGDALDLAVLLTAALRAEGILAYVALVRGGYGMDVNPDLPGLGLFNHSLVYVPAKEPVWIDPGDLLSRLGVLASQLQDRWALLVAPGITQLVRTPVARSADNRTETTIHVFMAEAGPSRVVETSLYYGAAERRQRWITSQVNATDRRLGYQAYVESVYRAEALGEVEESDVRDLTAPFRLRLEALRAARAWTDGDEAVLAIDLRGLISALPQELLTPTGPPRRGDFVFHQPFVAEWLYRIEPPPGMSLRELPKDLTRLVATGRLSRALRLEGSVVLVNFRFDSGPRRLSAEQLVAFRDAVQELLQDEALLLWFERKKRRAIDRGR